MEDEIRVHFIPLTKWYRRGMLVGVNIWPTTKLTSYETN